MCYYVYKVSNLNSGEYYYGKRSSKKHWKKDTYMGSGLLLNKKRKAHPKDEWVKEVLLLLDSEEEAYLYEKICIGDRWETDPLCLNLIEGGKGITSSSMKKVWEEKREHILECRRVAYLDSPEKLSKAGRVTQERHGKDIIERLQSWNNSKEGKLFQSKNRKSWFRDTDNKRYFIDKVNESWNEERRSSIRKPVVMLLNGVQTTLESRDLINKHLEAGYCFKNQYVHLQNKELGIWVEGVSFKKAKILLLSDKGWSYGKNRSLKKFSIRDIDLETQLPNGFAWDLWGGDAGKRWAESVDRKMKRADEQSKKK